MGAGETCGRWARGIVDKSSCTVLLKSVCIRNHAQMISAEGGERSYPMEGRLKVPTRRVNYPKHLADVICDWPLSEKLRSDV